MVTLHWYNETYTCEKAIKMDHEVILYDEFDTEIFHIYGIYGDEWDHVTIEGEWTDILSVERRLRADIDYLLMLVGE